MIKLKVGFDLEEVILTNCKFFSNERYTHE